MNTGLGVGGMAVAIFIFWLTMAPKEVGHWLATIAHSYEQHRAELQAAQEARDDG